MRAPLPLLVLGFVGGLIAACVDTTAPDDLDLENASGGRPATGSAKGGSPSKKTSPLPDDGTHPPGSAGPGPSPVDGGTPSSPDGSSPRPGEDAGKTPGPAPTQTPVPTTPFKRIDVRYPVDAGQFITQCSLDAKTQLVWKTLDTGTDAFARFADPAYYQQPGVFIGCGAKTAGEYPLVFTALAIGDLATGTYVAKCAGGGVAHVYRISGSVEGHPAATYGYAEQHAACP